MEATRQLFSVQETARVLGCGKTMVYRLIEAGELHTLKLGSLTRIPGAEIDALLDRLQAGSANGGRR